MMHQSRRIRRGRRSLIEEGEAALEVGEVVEGEEVEGEEEEAGLGGDGEEVVEGGSRGTRTLRSGHWLDDMVQ